MMQMLDVRRITGTGRKMLGVWKKTNGKGIGNAGNVGDRRLEKDISALMVVCRRLE